MSRALVLGLCLSVTTIACSKESSSERAPATSRSATPATATASDKDPAAARALITAGAVVIDVRTPEEYEAGHLPGAANIPVDVIGERLADIDALVGANKAAPIVVYCAAGRRAGKAKEQLAAAGFTQVVNGGGFSDLQ